MILSSHEVRWFFRGAVDQQEGLRKWVESISPIERDTGIAVPAEWEGRLNGRSDLYLIVPEHVDMGIKWREGQLQIKGLQCALGTHVFAGGRQGRVERWIKWSYKGEAIDQAFAGWFSKASGAGPRVIEVNKTRCLRKARLDPQTGKAREVSPAEHIERGCALEVSDLKVGTDSYCSVAFEGFPDDSAMHTDFSRFVNAFLEELPDIPISSANSMGYPAWLMSLATT